MKRLMNITGSVLLLLLLLLAIATAADAKQKKKDITFNFVDVEITSVAKFVSDITGKNFIFDDSVKGRITIIAPTKMSSDDAYDLFLSVLQLKGFALVPSGADAMKIIRNNETRQEGFSIYTADTPPINEEFIARVVTLEHINVNEAINFLKPVISRNGHLAAFGPGNLMLVVDSGINVRKVLELVDTIDQPSDEGEPEVVYLQNADAKSLQAILNEGIQKDAQAKGRKADSKVSIETRLNALILHGPANERASLMRLINLLDVPTREQQDAVNVFFLENADAEELAKVLKELLGANPAKAPNQPGTTHSPFLSQVNITPDNNTNSLVIIAAPEDYLSLTTVIRQLDRKRRQVYVEAMIVEASLDRLRELGTKWRATVRKDGEPMLVTGFGKVDMSTLSDISTGLSGLTMGGMGDFTNFTIQPPVAGAAAQSIRMPGLAALLSMQEFSGAVNILSSPQLLTSDNTEAEIHVGDNVPFVTSRQTDSTGAATDTKIDRKDVGISLKITPQVTEGDYVKLDIYQEISSVKETSDVLGPSTTKRSTKTAVVVRDQQTVVISGLMQEKEEETQTGVPGLQRIPLLGWLFKYKTKSLVKTNLLVFLTPHIIKEDVPGSAMEDILLKKQDQFARHEQMFVEGEFLIRFQKDTLMKRKKAILAEYDAEILSEFKDGTLHIHVGKDMKMEKLLNELLKHEEVIFIEPNYRMKTLN